MNFMDEALMEAQKAFDMGEVPVGAVIVKDNKIIGRGFNKKEILNSVVAHAEIMAIEDASRNLNNWRLNDCIMYVTLEPCPMCAGAILQSRISKIFIGANEFKAVPAAVQLILCMMIILISFLMYTGNMTTDVFRFLRTFLRKEDKQKRSKSVNIS